MLAAPIKRECCDYNGGDVPVAVQRKESSMRMMCYSTSPRPAGHRRAVPLSSVFVGMADGHIVK